ncbi:MAG: CotH kinase family protein [Ruminococcus sp.]|nr:CotH kinase family protein [Ruminococcus sp.]MBP3309303.1 CotH kinase family protein [Ruminococcus sp.]
MLKRKITSVLITLLTTAAAVIPQLPAASTGAADEQAIQSGDININGVVNAEDLQLLQKYLLGENPLALEQWSRADMNSDGNVDVFDLTILRKNIANSIGLEKLSGLMINEVCTSAKESVKDAAGNSPDWVELYNASDEAIDLSGIGLSDGAKNKFKFAFPEGTVIPADGFIVVYCDDAVSEAEGEYHAAFKLSADGETVYLTHPVYGEIDSVAVPELGEDITYGRFANGSEDFTYLSYTPGKTNNTASVVYIVEEPVFSAEGGFYNSEFNLTLSDAEGNEIYYTTDGSDPRTSPTAKLYSDSIKIYNNTNDPNVYSSLRDITLNDYTPSYKNTEKGIVVRAVTKGLYGRYSDVVMNTYFVGKNASYYNEMKVISMATDGDYLFDPDTGAYMIGSGYYEWLRTPGHEFYEPSDVKNPTNYNKDGKESEFPVSIQVFENGKLEYTTDVGARISGNWTRSAPQKSFRLYARSEYGDSDMKYAFFDELTDVNGKLIEKFDKVTIRNGGNDNQNLHFRDAMIQELAEDLACDTMASEPCILFIDGEFWGFYLIREKADGDYIEAHYGIDKEDVAVLKNGEVEDGLESDAEEFNKLCQWAMYADMTKDSNYQKFCEAVDLQSFMDYMTVETYINNNDWASGYINNWQAWRSKTVNPDIPKADGKWRFIFYDTDMSAGLYGSQATAPEYDSLNKNSTTSQSFNFPAVLRSLIVNETFRKEFYDNYIRIIDTTFAYDVVNAKITEYINAYGEATKATFSRFGQDWAANRYSNEVEILRNFFRSRPSYAKQYLEKYCDVKNIDTENLLPDISLWTYYGEAKFSSNQNNNTFMVNVSAATEKPWNIQSQARGLELETGKTYKLTFEASCSTPTELDLGIIHQVDSSFPGCWSDTVEVNGNSQKFELTFTMKEESASDWFLYFNFGKSSGNYVIKNARLVEV